jgi:hypothetical protein
MRSLAAFSLALFSVTSAIAHEQEVSVGPWTIATSFIAERFGSCTMSRSADLNITFVRSHDGLLQSASKAAKVSLSAIALREHID